MWNDRHNHLIQGIQLKNGDHLHDTTTYMQWYILPPQPTYLSKIYDYFSNIMACHKRLSNHNHNLNHNLLSACWFFFICSTIS